MRVLIGPDGSDVTGMMGAWKVESAVTWCLRELSVTCGLMMSWPLWSVVFFLREHMSTLVAELEVSSWCGSVFLELSLLMD